MLIYRAYHNLPSKFDNFLVWQVNDARGLGPRPVWFGRGGEITPRYSTCALESASKGQVMVLDWAKE